MRKGSTIDDSKSSAHLAWEAVLREVSATTTAAFEALDWYDYSLDSVDRAAAYSGATNQSGLIHAQAERLYELYEPLCKDNAVSAQSVVIHRAFYRVDAYASSLDSLAPGEIKWEHYEQDLMRLRQALKQGVADNLTSEITTLFSVKSLDGYLRGILNPRLATEDERLSGLKEMEPPASKIYVRKELDSVNRTRQRYQELVVELGRTESMFQAQRDVLNRMITALNMKKRRLA